MKSVKLKIITIAMSVLMVTGILPKALSQNATASKPNVIFILADNLGWSDLGCYGGTAPTPRLDQLASQGMRFKNYNVESQCTPSRSAILTGRLPIRTGNYAVPLPGQGDYGLVPWEYTLGELFSDAGYATAMYGKWHVGAVEGRLPNNQGFDEWWGCKNTSDESAYSSYALFAESGVPVPMLWKGVKGSKSEAVEPYDLKNRPFMDEKITQRTVDFIHQNATKGRPLFIYMAMTNIHPPMMAHPDFKGKSKGGVYSDILMELDYRTGQVLDALEKEGIAGNTIVVWSGDNGAGKGPLLHSVSGSSGQWRGVFGSGFEGGLRTPAIVRWPGKVPAGKVTDEIVCAVDWLPTLAKMVGAENSVPTDRPIDGINSADLLLGRSEKSNRDFVISHGPDGQAWAVKWKTMKVVLKYSEVLSGPTITPGWPMVFDLINDPSESTDLMAAELDCGWVFAPVFGRILALSKSAEKYPHIKPGQDSTG